MPDVIINAPALRIIKLLVGNVPKTVAELIEEVGVTRTAVIEQLNDLMDAGLVERSITRQASRGRPRHRFSATPAAMILLFASHQNVLVPAMWRAVEEVAGPEIAEKVLRRVSRSMIAHYAGKVTAQDPRERLQQFTAALEEEGGLVDMAVTDGHISLTKRSCAFLAMLDDERRVCTIDMELLSAVAGCPVRQIACRHDGATSCQFEVELTSHNGLPAQKEGESLTNADSSGSAPTASEIPPR